MQNLSRCKEKISGQIGRRRTYTCTECHLEFQEELMNPLPEKGRICRHCRYGYSYTFTDKETGQDIVVKATDSELATMRAWKINPNLTFKMTRPSEGI